MTLARPVLGAFECKVDLLGGISNSGRGSVAVTTPAARRWWVFQPPGLHKEMQRKAHLQDGVVRKKARIPQYITGERLIPKMQCSFTTSFHLEK